MASLADQVQFGDERRRMVSEQLVGRKIVDRRLIEAMRTIPRHLFVLPEVRHLAYKDGPLPIGSHQTISQPYIVALMTQLLHLQGDEKVLEIGTGSGYQAAILGKLARQVYTVERVAFLAKIAAKTIRVLEYTNVMVFVGDGSRGLPAYRPFDRIIITAAAPRIAQPVLNQLTDGGRLVVPVGGAKGQMLQRWHCRGEKFVKEEITPVTFVPLRGRLGWGEKDWKG